jgi:hypothetical protein
VVKTPQVGDGRTRLRGALLALGCFRAKGSSSESPAGLSIASAQSIWRQQAQRQPSSPASSVNDKLTSSACKNKRRRSNDRRSCNARQSGSAHKSRKPNASGNRKLSSCAKLNNSAQQKSSGAGSSSERLMSSVSES